MDKPEVYFNAREIAYRYPRATQLTPKPISLKHSTKDGVLSIEGPNGYGKTTLLSLILGELAPTKGVIERSMNFATNTACVFQRTGLFPNLTVIENLLSSRIDRQRIDSISLRHRIDHILDSPAALLSRGEEKRVQIARCVVSGRGLWIIDEATANLDQTSSALFLDDCVEHVVSGGGMVVVSHDYSWMSNLETSLLHSGKFRRIVLTD